MTNQDEWTEQELEGVSTTEIVRMLNEYQDMLDATRTYAHRNGESNLPTVDGWYHVLSDDDRITTIAWWSNEYGWNDPDVLLGFNLKYFYYGPIPVPTRKD